MRPDRLSTRIGLAFVAVALLTVVGLGATLFVALRGLHAEAATNALVQTIQPMVVQLRDAAVVRNLRTAITALRERLPEGITVHVVTAEGRVVAIGAADEPIAGFPLDPAADRGALVTGSVRFDDGQPHVYAATALRSADAPGVRWIVLADLDRSGAEALRDLLRTLPFVVLLVTVVGLPVALLLARSVTGPLRRLASATADLPAAASAPLPVEGPVEIRELTERFNAMATELRATRDHERRLLADLRHDLRTPLTVIGGFAAALSDGTATGDDAARAAAAIGEEAARLERLVAQLDALERLQAGSAALRPEALDAAVLVTETVARFSPAAAARGVSVEAAGPADPGDPELTFAADRVAVDRMLANLVENALAAVGEAGSHVWIAARPLPVVGRAGPGVALMVTDDGPGFGPGQAERVFERFYRGDPSRSGTGSGLGLAIVRDLARAHGGDAVAEHVAPHGARISVLLPRSPAPPVSRSL